MKEAEREQPPEIKLASSILDIQTRRHRKSRKMGDIGTVEGVEPARSYLKNGNETTDDKIEVLYVLSRIGKTECINPILKIATEPPLKTYAFTV
ncbi:MAG: hypothetical protein KAT88_03100 [Spirochaetes bacterium]|nr:hypothetical protein [Spirochaetota bacterium]